MTKTALANKERETKEKIAAASRAHEKQENYKRRQLDDKINQRSLKSQEKQAWIKAGSDLAGGALKVINDPAWYKNWLKDLNEFVNVPTYDRLGSGRLTGHIRGNARYAKVVPGILSIYWLPTIGNQKIGTTTFSRNPINQTLSRLKEKVLSLNSRSSVNWESGDLGYNLEASVCIAAAIEELGRVIRIYQTYHATNAYLAEALITAAGFSFTDIRANYSEYRKQYKLLARKFNNSIVIPSELGLFKRRCYLASQVFIDSDDGKYPRQMYLYVAQNLFALSEDATTCYLDANFLSFRNSLTAYVAWVENAIVNLADNPDFSEMYQDLRHAFGARLAQLDESVEDTDVVFNAEPLNREQLHNLGTFPRIFGLDPGINLTLWYLHQNASGYIYQGYGTGVGDLAINRSASYQMATSTEDYGYQLENRGHIFNMHKKDVTGDDILDITRGRFTIDSHLDAVGKLIIQVENCGSEVFTYMKMYSYAFDDVNDTFILTSDAVATTELVYWNDLNLGADSLILAHMVSVFDWAPICRVDVNDNSSTVPGYFGDILEYFTLFDAHTTFEISSETLARIHEAAYLGEVFVDESEFAR